LYSHREEGNFTQYCPVPPIVHFAIVLPALQGCIPLYTHRNSGGLMVTEFNPANPGSVSAIDVKTFQKKYKKTLKNVKK